jgi:hypothetical protein
MGISKTFKKNIFPLGSVSNTVDHSLKEPKMDEALLNSSTKD